MFKNRNYNNASQKRFAKFALIKYRINLRNYGSILNHRRAGHFGEVLNLANLRRIGQNLKPVKFKYVVLCRALLRFAHALAIGRSANKKIGNSF